MKTFECKFDEWNTYVVVAKSLEDAVNLMNEDNDSDDKVVASQLKEITKPKVFCIN